MKTAVLAILLGVLIGIMLPMTSLAQVKLNPDLKPEFAPSFTVSGGGRAQGALVILQIIAGSLIYIAGPLAVLMIVWGGSGYVTSRGDQNAMDGAKKTITWAILGLLVIMISYVLVTNVIILVRSTGETPATTTEQPSPAPTPPPSST